MTQLYLLGLAFSLIVCANIIRACVDEKGRSLDYYLVYKLPKLENSHNELIRSGFGYAYLSEDNAHQWQMSNRSINDPKSLVGATLKNLYSGRRADNSNSSNTFLYNDQPPKDYNVTSGASFAHAKGIFFMNSNSGFWLAHSVPGFPDLSRSSYSYPNSGRENGQILICISLDRKDSDSILNIGRHLLLIKPTIYSTKYSQAFLNKYPPFQDLIKKKWAKNQTQISIINSKKKVKFTVFSKSSKYIKDIYSQLIAPFVKEDLMVQTWRNGEGGKLDSDCQDEYKIMNIDQIKMSNMDWKYTEDHAKWAVSVRSKDKQILVTTCVSDLNRMRSQFKRGGGSICFQSPSIWSILNSTVEDIEACPLLRARLIPLNSTRIP